MRNVLKRLHEFWRSTDPPVRAAPTGDATRRRFLQVLVGGMILVGLGVVYLGIMKPSMDEGFDASPRLQPKFSQQTCDFEASGHAKEFLKKYYLKAPLRARFPNYPFILDWGGGCLVDSDVDEENSAGDMVRTQWMAVVQKTGGTWVLKELWTSETGAIVCLSGPTLEGTYGRRRCSRPWEVRGGRR